MKRGSGFFAPALSDEFDKLNQRFRDLATSQFLLKELRKLITDLVNFCGRHREKIKANLKLGAFLANLLHKCEELSAPELARKIMRLRCEAARDEDFPQMLCDYMKQYEKLFFYGTDPQRYSKLLASRSIAVKEIICEIEIDDASEAVCQEFFELLIRFVSHKDHHNPALQQCELAREVCVFILNSNKSSANFKDRAWAVYTESLYPVEDGDKETVLAQLKKMKLDDRVGALAAKLKEELPWYAGLLPRCGF